MKKYYTLAIKHECEDAWSIAYGSFSRQEIKQEAEDSYSEAYATKIIETAAEQSAIDYAINRLNETR